MFINLLTYRKQIMEFHRTIKKIFIIKLKKKGAISIKISGMDEKTEQDERFFHFLCKNQTTYLATCKKMSQKSNI